MTEDIGKGKLYKRVTASNGINIVVQFLCKNCRKNFPDNQLRLRIFEIGRLRYMLKILWRANMNSKLIIDRINEPYKFQALVIPHY